MWWNVSDVIHPKFKSIFFMSLWNAQDAQIESSKSNNVLITVDSGIHSYDM